MAEYRRFIASTFEEARKEMLRQMGSQAYIVKQNEIIKRSFFGFKKDRLVEIQAGKLSKPPFHFRDQARQVPLQKKNTAFLEEVVKTHFTANGAESNRDRIIDRMKRLITEKHFIQKEASARASEESFPPRVRRGRATRKAEDGQLFLELKERREKKRGDRVFREKRGVETEQKNGLICPVTDFLFERGFEADFIRWVEENYPGNPGEENFQKELAFFISSAFRYTSRVKHYASSPNVVIFIGPTGIGKTTTLAKIAAGCSVEDEDKSVLATFDVIRIMATAQLEKFANIMKIPFRILRGKSDLKKLINDFISYRFLFIDTAGTSPNNAEYLKEIREFVNYIDIPKEVHFCLNASLRVNEMEHLLDHFQGVGFDRVIITKVDESESMGPVLSVLKRRQLNISYVTNGQDVPNDIFLAEEKTMSKQMLREWSK